MELKGIFPALITPFEGNKPKPDWLLTILESFQALPLNGYVFLGSTGETAHLSDEERLQLLKDVLPAVAADRVKIVGSVFHGLSPTLRFLEAAANLGAQAGLVLTPHYFRSQMDSDTLERYYRQLADRSPIPILIYHFPAVTGIHLSAETVVGLSPHPNIAGCKDSAGDLTLQQQVLSRCAPGFALFTGSAATLYPSLICGAAGGILALANVVPEACVRLFQLVQGNQWARARILQQQLIALNTLVTRTYSIGGLKYAMHRMGLPAGEPRAPLRFPDQDGRARIDRELERLKDVLHSLE